FWIQTKDGTGISIVDGAEPLCEAAANGCQLRTCRCRAAHVLPQTGRAGGDSQRQGQCTLPLRPYSGGRECSVRVLEFSLTMQQLALDPQYLGDAPTLVVAIGACNRLVDGA